MTYARNTTVASVAPAWRLRRPSTATAPTASPTPPRATWPPLSSPWRTATSAAFWISPISRTPVHQPQPAPGAQRQSPAGGPPPGLPPEVAGTVAGHQGQAGGRNRGHFNHRDRVPAQHRAARQHDGRRVDAAPDRPGLPQRRHATATARHRALRTPARSVHPAAARLSHFIGIDSGDILAVGTGVPFVPQFHRQAGCRP